MIEDDQAVSEMRRAPAPERKPFMTSGEFAVLRKTVLRVTQARLAEQLIKPTTGEPVNVCTVTYWEKGVDSRGLHRPIPLWVARRMRDLAEAARRYDEKSGGTDERVQPVE